MNKSLIRYVSLTVLGVEAIFLLITAAVGAIYRESQFFPYLICGIIYGVIGLINTRFKPQKSEFAARDGFFIAGFCWIVLSFFGAIPIYFAKDIPNFVDALFEIVSGFTTTGSSCLNNIESLSRCSLFWRSLTHWLGGMGILVFILAVLPMGGGYGIHLLKAESTGPAVGKVEAKLSDTAKILYFLYSGLTVIMIFVLLIARVPLFESVTLSFATAGTGGFGIYADSIARYSSVVKIIIAVFALMFGVSFNIYYLMYIKKFKTIIKSEELKIYLCIVLISTISIFVNIASLYPNIFDAFVDSFFQVASIVTSTGFATCDFNKWPEFSKTILVLLMFIGACAGSTGGGLKVSRVAILVKDAFINLGHYFAPRRVKQVRFEGKAMNQDTISSTKSYFLIFAMVFVVSLLIISLNGYDFTTNFTGILTCINNIGPGLNVVGPAGNFADFTVLSKFVFMFDMLAGRLEFIPMLALLNPIIYRKK